MTPTTTSMMRAGADTAPAAESTPVPATSLSMFTGIGALDLGLASAGFRTVQMCESWEPARRVLADRFPGIPVHDDVATLQPLNRSPRLLAAGFPCTDLSHAGAKAGIFGEKSGLVSEVFRIVADTTPDWVLLENVPNLLALHHGAGMRHVIGELERLGFRWAYRTVDSRSFGVAQRRPRVLILASRIHDPVPRLLSVGVPVTELDLSTATASGFYWTEGRNGVGLVAGAVPTLKGGSPLGIPSAPAIWVPGNLPGRKIVVPGPEDGEALQGLPRGWTRAAVVEGEPDLRWKLVGNAVTVQVGRWIGSRIVADPPAAESDTDFGRDGTVDTIDRGRKWPNAGWGGDGRGWRSTSGAWPVQPGEIALDEAVDLDSVRPLSHRATTGFLDRLDKAGIKVDASFYADLEQHQQVTRPVKKSSRPSTWATDAATRTRMSRQRQRDTKPEVVLRSSLHALGLRYRLQVRPVSDLRARLDIVFGPSKVAVDVRGCFWHRCPLHATKPRTNADRWRAKLDRNVERDQQVVEALTAHGWQVVVVWEHDDPVIKAGEIAAIVTARRADTSRTVVIGGVG